MRVGLIGRTQLLLETARRILDTEDEIAFLYTTTAAEYATAGEDEFAAFAAEHAIPFFADRRILERTGELQADVCVSINWLTVLTQPFLDGFPYGVLNAHAGDLPRYRGNATLNWAILNGETEACLTVHRMVEELDAGPILLQRRRPIDDDTDITELYAWLEEQVPDAFLEALARLRAGTAEFTEQDPAVRPLRAYPRKPEDSRVVWSAPTESILRLIRASSHPFSGALTALEDGTPVRIFRARRLEPDHDALAIPGQVCFRHDGNPVIATGDGMLELLEVEVEGSEDPARTITRSLRNRLV